MAFYKNRTMERMNLRLVGMGIHFEPGCCLSRQVPLNVGLYPSSR